MATVDTDADQRSARDRRGRAVRPRPGRTAVAVLAAASFAVSACGDGTTSGSPAGDGAGGADVTSTDPTVVADAETVASYHGDRTFIDVRTPEEVAEGHVDGALLIDVQDPGFEDAVDELDRDTAYVVYCRTGNRSGQAIERMREMGFTDLVNGGAFDDLAAVGVPADPPR